MRWRKRPPFHGQQSVGLTAGTPLPAPAAETSGQPASWQLVLPAGTKRLVGLILVPGLLTAVGEGILAGAAISSASQRNNEINQLNAAIAQNNNAIE